MKVRFHGVRGSCASPGPDTARYGGNTSCVEVRLDSGEIFIIDCGTGIRLLGSRLLEELGPRNIQATILVSHFHWDHIQGFPFFTPAYIPGNRFRVFGGGVRVGTERMFVGQMEDAYFPVPLKAMGSDLSFHDFGGETVQIGPAEVSYCIASHPGVSLAFKIKCGKATVVYASDHEYRVGHEMGTPVEESLDIDSCDGKFLDFIKGADLYIGEGQYTAGEYRTRVGWGHSIWQDTLAVVGELRPRRFMLYHHDPDHSDRWVDGQVQEAQRFLAERGVEDVRVDASYEGLTVDLPEWPPSVLEALQELLEPVEPRLDLVLRDRVGQAEVALVLEG